ncbi:alpha/beta hydrolase [Elioraea thermophila]|uniref:alpha/beta hydrolase n=1 Tax=Elioraea thermophila TaxID=2185104 RepID=UPI000DF2B9B4|nr:alpha/beta hydrolase [Elioraea thermophila]
MARTASSAARPRRKGSAGGGGDLTVFFATNRNPVGDPVRPDGFGTALNGDGAELRFGAARFAGLAASWSHDVPTGRHALGVFAEDPGAGVLGSTELSARLQRLLGGQGEAATHDLLLYVHGFQTGFAEALALTARIAVNLEAIRRAMPEEERPRPLVPTVFTWPSDGVLGTRAYWSDVKDAERSGEALRRAVNLLVDVLAEVAAARPLGAAPRLVLMVQSLGHAVLASALSALDFPGGIDVVLSTGADIEADAFGREGGLRRLPELVPRTVVYHCERDGALQLSQKLRSNPVRFRFAGFRLGQRGPLRDPGVATVEAVDVGAVVIGTGDDTHHFYGRRNRTVQADMLRVLAGIPPSLIAGRSPAGAGRFVLGHGGYVSPAA